MATAALLPMPRSNFFDANGEPLAGGLVSTFIPSSATPKLSWQDAAETIPNDNPIVLDANGSCLLYGAGTYQITVTDALGNSIPAYSGLSMGTLASSGANFALIADLRANALIVVAPAEVEVTGYWTPGDGGAGDFIFVSTDHTSIDNGGTIIVDAAGQRWYRKTQAQSLNIRWFGAKGDGTTNDRTAIQNALNAGYSAVQIPFGAYNYGSGITVPDGVSLRGENQQTCALIATFLTGNCITLGVASEVTEVTLTSTGARTSGFTVLMQKNGGVLSDFVMANYFTGVGVVGMSLSELAVGCRVRNGNMFAPSTTANGAAVYVNDFANMWLQNMVISGTLGSQPTSSLIVANGDTCFIDSCNITAHGPSRLAPGAGLNLFGLTVENSLFDSSSGSALQIAPLGNVFDTKFSNCWFGLSATHGLELNGAAGAVDGLLLTGCQFVGNGAFGAIASGANCKNIQFNGGYASDNTLYGFALEGGATHVQFSAVRAGNVGTRGANIGGGILTQDACDYYTIVNCDLTTNTGPSLTDSATGVNKTVSGNLT